MVYYPQYFVVFCIIISYYDRDKTRMSLNCDVDDVSLQILSCIISIVIYIFIGSNLTFSVGMASFLSFPTLFGYSIWNRPVICRFISDIETRMGLHPITRMDSDISLLYCQDIPDSVIMNCKECD